MFNDSNYYLLASGGKSQDIRKYRVERFGKGKDTFYFKEDDDHFTVLGYNKGDVLMDENDDVVQELALKMIALHNFYYASLTDATKTVRFGGFEHCFDALSLCEYSSTLNCRQKSILGQYLNEYINKLDSEKRKCRGEYVVLFHFLHLSSYPYRDFLIRKEVRPDFVLEGSTKVGIEVLEFTTSQFAIMKNIANRNFGKGKTAEEIHAAAREKHGKNAEQFDYLNLGGVTAVSPKGLTDEDQKMQKFSEDLFAKWQKYKDMISEFDEFIVLCDARLAGFSDKEDCDSIMEMLELLDPNITGMAVCILYDGNSGISLSRYSL